MPYDYLVLCCGQQFQIAVPNGADINTLVTTAEVPRPRELVYRGKLPGNVFTINSHRDVQDTLRWIETSFAPNEGTVDVLKYFFPAWNVCEWRGEEKSSIFLDAEFYPKILVCARMATVYYGQTAVQIMRK